MGASREGTSPTTAVTTVHKPLPPRLMQEEPIDRNAPRGTGPLVRGGPHLGNASAGASGWTCGGVFGAGLGAD